MNEKKHLDHLHYEMAMLHYCLPNFYTISALRVSADRSRRIT